MKKGFTLIELSIALLILGIIAGITLPLMLQSRRAKNMEIAKREMDTYKKRVITYYQTYSRIPIHTPTFTLPHIQLQIPRKFVYDPISGIPYRYFADTLIDGDPILIDGTSIGDIGAVIISAGQNAKFDGENADPSNKRFQSTGTGDFDDILIYIAQNELITLQSNCTVYFVRVVNNTSQAVYVFPAKTQLTYTSIPAGSFREWTNIDPNEFIFISSSNAFTTITTNAFVPAKYDKNGNCRVHVSTTNITNSVPIFSTDLD